jgi:hypothetical protein
MMFVASQIVIWLILAAIFGFFVGWVAKGRGGMKRRKRRRF